MAYKFENGKLVEIVKKTQATTDAEKIQQLMRENSTHEARIKELEAAVPQYEARIKELEAEISKKK